MLVIIVEFHVLPAKRAEFLERISENARQSLSLEKDCRRFDVCVDPHDETMIFLYEVYADTASFQQHLASAHYYAFDTETKNWVTSKVVRNLGLHFNSLEVV